MNIIIKLIQIIHWSALAIVALCLLVAFSDNNLPQVTFMIFNSLIFKGGSHPTELIVSISFYLLILIPFLKYLIFGKIGWFPDTYVMNKNTKQSIVDDNIEDSINTPKDSIETKKER